MKRLRIVALALTITIGLLSAAGAYIALDDQSAAIRAGQSDRADLRKIVEAEREKSALLAAQVQALGEEPVVTPDKNAVLPALVPIPGKDGADGAPGPGPTFEQVLAGVRAYCAANNGCRGPGPSDDQLADAIAAYCEAHNECRPEDDDGDGEPTDEPVEPPVDNGR